jgi:HAMP domain-containing protein
MTIEIHILLAAALIIAALVFGAWFGLGINIRALERVDVIVDSKMLLDSVQELVDRLRKFGLDHLDEVKDVVADAEMLRESLDHTDADPGESSTLVAGASKSGCARG